MAELTKEIWLSEIMEGFYGNDSFLEEVRDMSAFVENGAINLAEAGVNPKALVNNSVYPVPIAEREDDPISLPLKVYDTENTVVRNAHLVELAYDKLKSITYGHRMALRMQIMSDAIFNYAPVSTADYTPILKTSGSNDGSGKKAITFEDILDLSNAFDGAEIPSEGRVLVLSTKHKSQLMKQDLNLYRTAFGKENAFAGFKLYALAEKRMPRYNHEDGTKIANGAASSESDTISSIAFHREEVMKCQSDFDMFFSEKTPEQRGDVIGFQVRAANLPIRGKGIGAIYSSAV